MDAASPNSPARSPHSAENRAKPAGTRQTVPGECPAECQAHHPASRAAALVAMTVTVQLHIPCPAMEGSQTSCERNRPCLETANIYASGWGRRP